MALDVETNSQEGGVGSINRFKRNNVLVNPLFFV